MEKTNLKMSFWMVVWNKKTGDFRNARMEVSPNEKIGEVESKFEQMYSDYRVIHIGMGEFPPKNFQSLEYL